MDAFRHERGFADYDVQRTFFISINAKWVAQFVADLGDGRHYEFRVYGRYLVHVKPFNYEICRYRAHESRAGKTCDERRVQGDAFFLNLRQQ